MKKLYRSDENKVFAGIIGGFGDYFDMDPIMLRALWIIVTAITGFLPAIIAYLILIFIIPKKGRK